MNEKLRILALDLNGKQILNDLSNDALFNVTSGKIRTAKPEIKPDVIIINYNLIPGDTRNQNSLMRLNAAFINKPLIIAYKEDWFDEMKKHAQMFLIRDTVSDNDNVPLYIKNRFLYNEDNHFLE